MGAGTGGEVVGSEEEAQARRQAGAAGAGGVGVPWARAGQQQPLNQSSKGPLRWTWHYYYSLCSDEETEAQSS